MPQKFDSSTLRMYRAKIQLTQKEVGDRIGLTALSYANIENGKSDIRSETLLRLIKMFEGKGLKLKVQDFYSED